MCIRDSSNGGKSLTKPFCSVAKETILGNLKPLSEQVAETGYKQDSLGQQKQMSERERRLLLRDMERKKKAISNNESGGYGQLSAAGANIVEQHHYSHDVDVSNKQCTDKSKEYTNVGLPQLDGNNKFIEEDKKMQNQHYACLLYTSPSPRDLSTSRMPSSA
eukprot:TRINITY_DN663_c0_g1_i1.p2 TRINITY_DN663_c0_g1~~TRINITY_DN663_c0_g1_i1.p2  ORF type:complete len:162 (+),score=68.55 TRINITY_DN663_c0_g1_i1:64-549(+)